MGGNGSPSPTPTVEPSPTPVCPFGQVECYEQCIPFGQPCTRPCPGGCTLPNANSVCNDGTCEFTSCHSGFIDCDGDPSNGCELDFNFTDVTGNTLHVRRLDLMAADPWAGIPLVPLVKSCSNCQHTDDRVPQTDPVNADPPPSTSLRAGFALGWHDAMLYLKAQVYDNDLPTLQGPGDARNYDNIEFIFDGFDDTQNGPDDRHIFIGFDGEVAELDGNSLAGLASFESEVIGACYTITARLSAVFLSGGGERQVQLQAGRRYHFNIAVNDYDRTNLSNPNSSLEHVGHLFFRGPSHNYWWGTRGDIEFPYMELIPGGF